MKKIMAIATLLLAYSNVFSADFDSARPTEYVLQFLAKSSSLWKGDQNWLSKLISNPQSQATTVFVEIEDLINRKPQGFDARVWHRMLEYYKFKFTQMSGNAASGKFKITRNNETVTITSNIQEIELQTATTPEAITDLQSKCIKLQSIKAEIKKKDTLSTCKYHVTGMLESDNKLKIILNATCTTTMKFDEFFKAVKKAKDE